MNLWPNNKVITVGFIDGREDIKSAVRDIATEWTTDTGVKFDFIATSSEAAIRVSLSEPGNWSYLGTAARKVPTNQATIALGTASEVYKTADLRLFKKIVLNEFGHALGLISEHQNPNANLRFNLAFIRQTYGWDNQTIQQNFSPIHARNYRSFDPTSVMIFAFPHEFFVDGSHFDGGYDLSAGDKVFIRKLYPKS